MCLCGCVGVGVCVCVCVCVCVWVGVFGWVCACVDGCCVGVMSAGVNVCFMQKSMQVTKRGPHLQLSPSRCEIARSTPDTTEQQLQRGTTLETTRNNSW